MNSDFAIKLPERPSVYIVYDVEADGPSPAENSCIQMGFVAFTLDYEQDFPSNIVSSLDLCMEPDKDQTVDRDTSEFWDKFSDIRERIRINQTRPHEAIKRLECWLLKLSEAYKIERFVAGPSSYDWQWVNCYWHKYGGGTDYSLGYSSECFSSLKRAMSYSKHIHKDNIDEIVGKYDDEYPHTHYALDDAMREAAQYFEFRKFLHNM